MLVSIKDSLKFFGVSIVCFCAVFVCTFFLNYYIDVLPLKSEVPAAFKPLYDAQLATARMTTAITGGFLSVIAVIMLLFYIKLYIESHCQAIGIFKAMGYSNAKISISFLVFGVSVLVGCALGFSIGWAVMPYIYKNLTIDGLPDIAPKFHFSLLIILVIMPTLIFTLIALLYANVTLKKPVLAIMKGENVTVKRVNKKAFGGERGFLKEMCFATLRSKKMLAFFIAFSAFCFSAMVQMSLSMENLVDGTMGIIILIIGLVLAVVSMFMAMTSLVNHNAKNVAVMKAMGFNKSECFICIFSCYIPLLLLGFAIGTIYQYGLLSLMVNLIFKDVGEVPEYHFNVPVLFLTLTLFLVLYSAVFAVYLHKANKTPVKKIMTEA